MIKRLNKMKIIRAALVVGVVIIPLLYSYLYLGAFWDPYSTLDDLPVAVVNNDGGAIINGKQRNLGQELCNELNEKNSLKFIVEDEATAKTGTEGDEYYAMIVVPSDFSADVASASKVDKQTATITFSANEKRNYLASQILSKATIQIEEKLRSNVNKEITAELSSQLKAAPKQLGKLRDGFDQLKEGSTKLSDGTTALSKGASKLTDGTSAFSDAFSKYQTGVESAESGSNSLSTGISSLDSGIDKLLAGATTLDTSTQSLTSLQQGANELAIGAATFKTNLVAYTSGVDALIKNVTDTTTFLSQYVRANPSLMNDPTFAAFITSMSSPDSQANIKALSNATTSLQTAAATISDGISQLASSTDSLTQLQAAVSKIKSGLEQAKKGSAKLAKGTNTLSTGMTTVSKATNQLDSAASDINNGAISLKDGTGDLHDGAGKLLTGITTADDGVTTSITDANKKLASLDGLDKYASEPVSVKTASINPVPNYGTAFAPYFLSLSLWVGAIIIFVGIFMDTENRFKILSRDSNKKVKRTFVYLLIGFTQAVVLAVVLKLCLGLQVNNEGLYFASCCLVSIVFLSIVQFLMVFLKDVGKFLSLLLLIMQLTSCGGTFPMETVPQFFNILYPFMPMTYSVNLFKEAISGGDMNTFWFNAAVLFAILLVFTTITIILSKVKSYRKKLVKTEVYA